MKKFSVLALSMFFALAVISCGTTSMKDMDPKAMAKDAAVKEASAKAEKEAAKASCKKSCDTAYDDCVKKAGKSKAKAKACETNKTKCYADCDKK